MKVALPAALIAFVLGSLAGVLFERRRHEPPAVAPAPASLPSADALAESDRRTAEAEKRAAERTAEVTKLKEKIAKLEKAGSGKSSVVDGKKELTPEEAKARLEELRAQIPDIVAKKDGKALIKLMQEIAALGPIGYKTAIEISGIIAQDVEGGKNELGLSRNEFWMAFDGPMLPVMAWGLMQGDDIAAGFRAGSAYGLSYHPEMEPGKLFMELLKTEKSSEVLRAIAENMEGVSKAGMEKDIASLLPQYAENPRMLTSMLDALVKIGSADSLASLEALARGDNEILRKEAAIAMIALKPPVEGIFVSLAVPNSQADNVGIKRGDIITSYNGSPVKDLEALQEQMDTIPAGTIVEVMLNRDGEMVPLQIKSGSRIGINGKDVKPK
ncbi:MAG: PDZ domain-containing protein [Planctomycetota bacterium]